MMGVRGFISSKALDEIEEKCPELYFDWDGEDGDLLIISAKPDRMKKNGPDDDAD